MRRSRETFMFEKNRVKTLAVDDDAEVLRTIKRILEKKGHEVFAYDSAGAALEHLKKETVDLILTDLKMPEMDGIQFLSRAKALRPYVPVILITGFATIETAVSAIKWGAFDYVRKPFEVKKIYEVIEGALGSKKGGA